MHGNLLSEPLFGVAFADGRRETATLPRLLALWSAGESAELTGLQAHQQHAFYAFCVQLAALAMVRVNGVEPPGFAFALPTSPDLWEMLLATLTDGAEAPWCLYVEELNRPAFMQPPVHEGKISSWDFVEASDAIDTPLTAKNHDVKSARAYHATPEQWVFALVSLQTMQGNLGRGNYGCARMKGGYGSRCAFSLARDGATATRFVRDVAVWLESREGSCAAHGYRRAGGRALLWTEAWRGAAGEGLTPGELDPFFIEVCRRMRLAQMPSGITRAYRKATSATRVDMGVKGGVTGDAWVPVAASEKKPGVLTVGGDGLHYGNLSAVLFDCDRWRLPPSAIARPEDGPAPRLIARVLVRGQGKTDGYHDRHLPVPGLQTAGAAAAYAARGLARVEDAALARRKIMHVTVCVFLQGAPAKLNLKSKDSAPFCADLDRRIDRVFFERLFADRAVDDATAQRAWRVFLVAQLRAIVFGAIDALRVPSGQRERIRATAERVLVGSCRKHFPDAFANTPQEMTT